MHPARQLDVDRSLSTPTKNLSFILCRVRYDSLPDMHKVLAVLSVYDFAVRDLKVEQYYIWTIETGESHTISMVWVSFRYFGTGI